MLNEISSKTSDFRVAKDGHSVGGDFRPVSFK